jgi:hypothetical protein
MRVLGAFLMSPAEIVGTANQVHPGLQGAQASSRMPTLACQVGEPLRKCAIQAFDEGGIELLASMRKRKQVLSLLHHPMRHLASDLHHAPFRGSLDHRPNV